MPHCTSRFCLTVRFCKIYTFHQDGRLSSRICDRHLAQRRNHVFSELEDVISNLAVEQVNSFSSVRAAIISPSPATYRLASQGQRSLVHPFVSFQMTIKMGRRARTGADWKSSNIWARPLFRTSFGCCCWNPPLPSYYKFLPPQTAFLLVIHYCPGGWFPQCNLAHFPSKTKQNSCFKHRTDWLFHLTLQLLKVAQRAACLPKMPQYHSISYLFNFATLVSASPVLRTHFNQL